MLSTSTILNPKEKGDFHRKKKEEGVKRGRKDQFLRG